MATTGHTEDAADHAAAVIHEASFVHVTATADGDALAAAGLLARALTATDTPYQASIAAVPDTPGTDVDCTVAIGHHAGDVTITDTPAAISAASLAETLTEDTTTETDAAKDTPVGDPVLALAGGVCAGAVPSGALLDDAELTRQPGVAIPTPDPVAGLTYSTRVHTAVSGQPDEVEAALDGVGDAREQASFLSFAAVQDAPPRAADVVQHALHPYACPRFETLGGYADILDAVARTKPGIGIVLALHAGTDVAGGVTAAARDCWETHGNTVHAALHAAETNRYQGLYVAHVDEVSPAVLGSVGRLLFEYRSPEPLAVVVTDDAATAVGTDPDTVHTTLNHAADEVDGDVSIREAASTAAYAARGTAVFDDARDAFVAAFREAQ